MSYSCHFCEQESQSAHTITTYDHEGIEQNLEILCDTCYDEWLHSIKE